MSFTVFTKKTTLAMNEHLPDHPINGKLKIFHFTAEKTQDFA